MYGFPWKFCNSRHCLSLISPPPVLSCSMSLQPPDWLTQDELRRMLAEETASHTFTPIPERFLETAQVMLRVAGEDLNDADQVDPRDACDFIAHWSEDA